MTTLGDFKKILIRKMADTIALDDEGNVVDPISGGTLDADTLLDACRAALRAITERQWKSSIFDISEEGSEFDLPDDLIEVNDVLDRNLNVFIPKMVFTIGVDQTSLANVGNSWVDSPNGKIVFNNSLKSTGAKVFYSAAWSLIPASPSGEIDDESVLEAPEFCLTALILYAASYCFSIKAAAQAELAQFKTRVDSGQPIDLPAKEMSVFLLKRYENELTRIPMKQKGSQ